MKENFLAKVKKDEKGKHYADFNSKNDVKLFLSRIKVGKNLIITIGEKGKQRTPAQNNALHLFYQQWADAMNEAGISMKTVFEIFSKKGLETEWSLEAVKDIWRCIQKAKTGKKETRKLKKDELDGVYEEFNKIMGEITKIHIPFPNIEDVIMKY